MLTACSAPDATPTTASAVDVTRGKTTLATFHSRNVSAMHFVSNLNRGKSAKLKPLLSRSKSANIDMASSRTRSWSGWSLASCISKYCIVYAVVSCPATSTAVTPTSTATPTPSSKLIRLSPSGCRVEKPFFRPGRFLSVDGVTGMLCFCI